MRYSQGMIETLSITTEQINDLPFLLSVVTDMGIGQAIDAQIQPHGGWQGISVGTVVQVWLCHMLMERDHRLVSVRDWATARAQTLTDLLGVPLRDTDLTDDRLANVLTMLRDPADQAAIDQALLADWMRVYRLPRERVRLDSTSVSVYHEQDDPPAASLLRPGHSKDHRPDLPQFKAMLASLDPLGLPLACHVVPGNAADDGLYVPAYDAAVRTLGTAAMLLVGDSKMGALGTRAHIVAGGSAYLCAYRPPRATAEIAGWIEEALTHPDRWHEVWAVDAETGESTPLAVIDEWTRELQEADTVWTERVLVVRSAPMQAGLRRTREEALARLTEQLEALRRPPARGRPRYRTAAAVQRVVADLLATARLQDIVQVEVRAERYPDGTVRWIVGSYAVDLEAWRAMVERLGWQVYVSSTTAEQYSAPALVDAYRHQVIQERGFARLKTRNLHIRPVYLSDEGRITALTWLLCLALRVLTLTEYRVRTALQQRDEALAGLNPASRAQATTRPTAERLIQAFQNMTRTCITAPDQVLHHVTPLTPTQEHILSLLALPRDLYARLGTPLPQPLVHLRE